MLTSVSTEKSEDRSQRAACRQVVGGVEIIPPGELLSGGEWRQAVRVLKLSTQEARIAALIMYGGGHKHIAAILQTSPNTLREHMRRMYVKLHVRQQMELVRVLVATGKSRALEEVSP
jgi:DNA-binding NarL/FixJ family response regulator